MITGINHITFAVKNLEKSLDFYINFLGCKLAAKWEKGAYLQAGNLWICLSLDDKAQSAPPQHYSHIAFDITPKNFDKMHQTCMDNNVQFWKENTSEGESLYILDPDFHKLEIHYSTLRNRLKAMRVSRYQGQEIFTDKKMIKTRRQTPIILFGSSRSDGDTRLAIDMALKNICNTIPVLDLSAYKIQEFSYEYNQDDDFQDIIQAILKYDTIILATPIYWYSVSAKMKCFIDRLSDLLVRDKVSAEALKNKKLAVIASYKNHPAGMSGFEKPLMNTANYLEMIYLTCYFHYSGTDQDGIEFAEQSFEKFKRYFNEIK